MDQHTQTPFLDVQCLTPVDFAAAIGEQLSRYLVDRIAAYDLRYRLPSPVQRDAHLRNILDAIYHTDLVAAGTDRLQAWEAGWGAHVDRIKAPFDPAVLLPGYFGKYPVLRWRQQLIEPVERDFEYKSFAMVQDWLFDKYFREFDAIYEFGCGTGHNLFRVRAVNPSATLWGLDWVEASQAIIGRLSAIGADSNMKGRRFNYFDPDPSFALEENAAIYTAASLEQIGDKFKPFVDFLLKARPRLCLHIEPISELLDEHDLLDFLSIKYAEKRRYLSGFLDYLRALEKEGRLKIHMQRRSFVGSRFIDGYSVVAWSPV